MIDRFRLLARRADGGPVTIANPFAGQLPRTEIALTAPGRALHARPGPSS